MPLYVFSHPKTGELREIFFHMNDEKSYQDDEGVNWVREYGSPQLNTNGTVDAWDKKGFVNQTSSGGTIGDLLDRSSDLSKERASQSGGVDPVKEKYYKQYSKERNGALHPDKMPKSFENKHIKIDL